MRGVDAIAVCKAHPVCAVCAQIKKNAARRSLASALVVKCYWLLCVSHDRLCHATGREYLFEWDVSALTERDHFQLLKPYVLLSSSQKDIAWLQKTWNATRLVCNAFILLFLWSVFAINTCDYLYLPVKCFILFRSG